METSQCIGFFSSHFALLEKNPIMSWFSGLARLLASCKRPNIEVVMILILKKTIAIGTTCDNIMFDYLIFLYKRLVVGNLVKGSVLENN